MNAGEDFRAAMVQAGLHYAGPLIADGKLHRFKVEGDHERNSWYVRHGGPPAAGAFGCWKRGIKETWCAARNGDLSQSQRAEVRQLWCQAEQLRERTETQRRERACKVAQWVLARSKPAPADHAYLSRKGVPVLGRLLEYRGALVMPLRNMAGEVLTLQFIGEDGTKRFLSGGRVSGTFFPVRGDEAKPVVICEGYATGASIRESTGCSVVCAMNCGNILAVAQAVRAKLPANRGIIVAADDDKWTKGNPGVAAAHAAARAVGGRLAVPKFKDTATKATDFNDLAQAEGPAVVRAQIEAAEVPGETEDELLTRLAALPPLEYERTRKAAAERLGIARLSALDAEVEQRRPKAESNADQGSAVKLPAVQPWPEPVDGAEVLASISDTFSRYIALPPGAADAAALWASHAHCPCAFEHSPRLNPCSPEKQCGKTLLLDVLSCVVPRPLRTESLTAAVLFRLVDSQQPTLLLDECDSFLGDNEELRGLLNAGHKKGAKAFRCEGDSNAVRGFNAFGPAALAGIGNLPGTLFDRSIVIRLTRAKPGEVKARFDSRHVEREAELCRKLARWVSDNFARLEGCDPVLPNGAFNRLADNWRPLFAVAEVAGGDWPQRAREAFRLLTTTADLDAQGIGAVLLSDIRDMFGEAAQTRLASSALAVALAEIEGRPWAEFGRSRKPISPNQLAQQLRKFAVAPRMMVVCGEEKNRRGYDLADFAEAFERFLPAQPGATAAAGQPAVEVQSPSEEREPADALSL